MNPVAATIFSQLGGNRFVTMTGAKDMCYGDHMFSCRFAGSRAANHIRIELKGNDLYKVTFCKIVGCRMSAVTSYDDVSNDKLREIFESHTKLYTSL